MTDLRKFNLEIAETLRDVDNRLHEKEIDVLKAHIAHLEKLLREKDDLIATYVYSINRLQGDDRSQ